MTTRYLAISKTPYQISYSVFEGVKLERYGRINLSETNEFGRILEWKNLVAQLIQDVKPTFLLTHLLDYDNVMKKDIERIVEVRTILKLVSIENNAIYIEFKTDGWEKRIIGRPTAKRKLDFVNRGYDIKIDSVEIADSIILCEGVAHDRLKIAR